MTRPDGRPPWLLAGFALAMPSAALANGFGPMGLVIYGALLLTFFIIATGISAILRPFLPPRWQAVIMALFTAMVWAPVRWWGAGADGALWSGWHPLIGGWFLGEPDNRPGFAFISFAMTALLAYAAIRLWTRRRPPTGVTLH